MYFKFVAMTNLFVSMKESPMICNLKFLALHAKATKNERK